MKLQQNQAIFKATGIINYCKPEHKEYTIGTIIDVGDMSSSTDPFVIGVESDFGLPFNGRIDSIQMFNYALTPTKIKTVMNSGAVRWGPVTGAP